MKDVVSTLKLGFNILFDCIILLESSPLLSEAFKKEEERVKNYTLKQVCWLANPLAYFLALTQRRC